MNKQHTSLIASIIASKGMSDVADALLDAEIAVIKSADKHGFSCERIEALDEIALRVQKTTFFGSTLEASYQLNYDHAAKRPYVSSMRTYVNSKVDSHKKLDALTHTITRAI